MGADWEKTDGPWVLLDEIERVIHSDCYCADEVITALVNSLAKILVMADHSPKQIEFTKQLLDSYINMNRGLLEDCGYVWGSKDAARGRMDDHD